jgi:hypothetical protein
MPSANRGLNEVFQGVTLLNTESNLNNTQRLSNKEGREVQGHRSGSIIRPLEFSHRKSVSKYLSSRGRVNQGQ